MKQHECKSGIMSSNGDETDEDRKHISAAAVAPLNMNSLHGPGSAICREEKYFTCSADEEFESLMSSIASYRNTLSDGLQNECDGKLC
jgi:hypothetical protein